MPKPHISPKRSRRKQSSALPPRAHTNPSSRAATFRNTHAYILLVIVTLIAYANAWPDTLTFDDIVFVDSKRFEGLGLAEILRFFTEDLWAASGASSSLYRPLLLVSIAMEAQIFGDWMSGYHLVNILLHVMATLLVYGFIRHLLLVCGSPLEASVQAAFLAALIFGVHPIHTEVVNSIFNRSEMLVSIGVVGGLWWFLQSRESRPNQAWFGLSLIYLPILLCRESGAALPVLAVAMLWLTSSEPWRMRLRQCIPVLWLLIPLVIYLALRTHALDSSRIMDTTGFPVPGPASKIADLSMYGMVFGPERLLPAIRLWFESLNILFWPHPLQIYYDEPETSAVLVIVVQMLLLGIAIALYLHKRPGFLIGLGFFYVAILSSSRIIGEAGAPPALADRFLYLPSVGLAIVLAFGLQALAQRFSVRAAAISVMIIALVLTPLTWARNALWAHDLLLLENDYGALRNKDPILNSLVTANLREENVKRAVEICDTHAKARQERGFVAVQCGSAYGHVGRFRDAEQAFLNTDGKHRSASFAHLSLAMMYVHLDRIVEAQQQFEQALAVEKLAFLKEYFRAMTLIQLHPTERASLLEAKSHLEQAIQLQPQHVDSRVALEQLNQELAPPER